MDANGHRDAAQRILEGLAADDLTAAMMAYDEYFQLYSQLGCGLRGHLRSIGLAESAVACRQRLCDRVAEGSLSGDFNFGFLNRLIAGYSPIPARKERLLADAPA